MFDVEVEVVNSEYEVEVLSGGSGGGGGVPLPIDSEDVLYDNTAHEDVETVRDALDMLFSKVYYVKPVINTFVAVPAGGSREIGSKVNGIEFTWTLNKNVVSQSLADLELTADDRTATYADEISAYKRFTLSVTDEVGETVTKNIDYNFLPKVYYGSAAEGTYDSAFVIGLSNGVLKSAKGGSYAVTVATGQYGYIAMPSSFNYNGTCKIGGFDTDLTDCGVVSVTNASGYTQNYKLFRTPNKGLGAITMEI